MALKIKRRCIRCMTVLRENGTCQNQDCPRCVHEQDDAQESKQEKS